MEGIMRTLIALFLLAASAAPVLADISASTSSSSNGTVSLQDRRDIARRVPIMPVAEAQAIALRRVPGKVLAMEIETNDGIRTWQIDIRADTGRTVRLWLNAGNGDFLRMAER
jgi:uncharacterized membrane protein YkoI